MSDTVNLTIHTVTIVLRSLQSKYAGMEIVNVLNAM